MTRARDIANLVDANGDIVVGALDNVPAADLVNDTTPQLGGALDAQTNNITSVGNLGVGTSSPSQKVHVEGAGNQFIYLNNSTTSDSFYFKAGTGASSIQTGGGSNVLNFFTAGTERMKIDSSGRVTMPTQPSFNATGVGQWYTVSNGAYTVIPYTSTNHNIGNHFNTSTSTFTAPIAGRYLMCFGTYGRLQGGQGDNTRYWFSGFLKNGAALNNTSICGYQNDGDYDFGYTQSGIFELAANDTMQVYGRAGGSYNGEIYQANCFFHGQMIG